MAIKFPKIKLPKLPNINLPKIKLHNFKVQFKKASNFQNVFKNKQQLLSKFKKVNPKYHSGKIALLGGGVTFGIMSFKGIADYVVNYQNENSGCFLKHENGKVCKVTQLSCCNSNVTDKIPPCENVKVINEDACENFIDDGNSCCEECNSNNIVLDQQQLSCTRASVSDALTNMINTVNIFDMTYQFDSVTHILTSVAYLTENNEEFYPVSKINGDEQILENRYIKLKSGLQIYPKKQNGDDYDYNNEYAKLANENQYYPRKKDGTEFALNNVYCQDKDGNQLYPKNKDSKEIVVNNVYCEDKDGNKFYPRLPNDDEYIHNHVYCRDKSNNEFYPKKADGKEEFADSNNEYARDAQNKELYPVTAPDNPFIVNKVYAQDAAGASYYPEYKDDDKTTYFLVLNNPVKFISTLNSVGFENLHKVLSKEYLLAKKDNTVGQLYETVDETTHAAWKKVRADLPDRFVKASSEPYEKLYNVYKRDKSKDMFIIKERTEILVDFDKRNFIHYYTRINSDKDKRYFFEDGQGNKFYYTDINNVLYKDDQDNLVFSNNGGVIILYTRKDDKTISLLTAAKVAIANQNDITVAKFVQELDENKNIVCKIIGGALTFLWYENAKVVYFDYIKKKTEKKRYKWDTVKKAKSYFKFDANQAETDITTPTEVLNEEVDAKSNILSKSIFCIFTKVYTYIVLLFLTIAIYLGFRYYPMKSSSIPTRVYDKYPMV